MNRCALAVVLVALLFQRSFSEESLTVVNNLAAKGGVARPYITTQTPITLLSANDGDLDFHWRKTRAGLRDREVKTQDSFTVIHLGPDHPPITRTVYGTVPSTILGTPTMAMSADGRYGIIANHGLRGATDLAP